MFKQYHAKHFHWYVTPDRVLSCTWAENSASNSDTVELALLQYAPISIHHTASDYASMKWSYVTNYYISHYFGLGEDVLPYVTYDYVVKIAASLALDGKLPQLATSLLHASPVREVDALVKLLSDLDTKYIPKEGN